MFERFTRPARDLVRDAVRMGEEQGGAVTPDHLFLALFERGDTLSARLLEDVGLDRGQAIRLVVEKSRRGGLTRQDAEALAELGIDVEAVVEAVERDHGEGAMATGGRRRRSHTPFTREAKKVLEQALREALDLRDKHIGDEHVLLALLTLGAVEDVGVGPADVRAKLMASRRGTGTR